jgi:hypothetical protein
MKRIGRGLALLPAAGLLAAACSAGPTPSPSPLESFATETSSPAPSQVTTASPSPPAQPTASEPTPQPYPSVFVPESDSFDAGLRYECYGVTFPLEIMEGPSDAEKSGDPATVVLGMDVLPSIEEWWVIERTPTDATYLGRDVQEFGATYMGAQSTLKDGQWRPTGWGTCWGAAIIEDATPISWWVRNRDRPAPGDRTLEVRARSLCPDTLPDRLIDPIVRYAADRIVVILGVDPPGDESCGYRNQVTGLTIQLDEPVGSRSLWDGERIPWRDARIPSEPIVECCG